MAFFESWLYGYTDESVKLQMQAGMSRGGLGIYSSVCGRTLVILNVVHLKLNVKL